MQDLHSYRYGMQRVVTALITHDADPRRSPMRRAGATALIGVLAAALTVGGVAAYGLFTGHTMTEATDTGAVLLEKRTGARYVYRDGRLHPVLNYASGLLLTDGDRPSLKAVPAEKLAKLPLGAPLGIPGAPDALPAADDLLTGAWSVCTSSSGSTLLVGVAPSGGAPLADRALLVSDEAGRTHLVHANRRFLLAADRVDATQRALGWFGRTPWPVAAAWADAIPAGPDLSAPRIPGAGAPSVIAGRRAGDVVTDGSQFAVVLTDGIAPVSETGARLLGTPDMIGAAFRELPASVTRLGPEAGLPARVPALADPPAAACVAISAEAEVRVNDTVPRGAAPAGPARVDRVHVPRGRGALVEAVASAGAPAGSGTVHLVTDDGRRYPLASPGLAGRLGYPGRPPHRVPARLVAYLPPGPALDPSRAGRP
jgi:type VII secretion protein EccB